MPRKKAAPKPATTAAAPAPSPAAALTTLTNAATADIEHVVGSIPPPSAQPRLSLLQIDEELFRLINLLIEAREDPGTPSETIHALQDQIGLYASKEEAKVNSIAYTHFTCLNATEICKRQAAHYTRMGRRWAAYADSIEQSVHRTMILTGANEYKSAEHRLALVGVGGVEPLEYDVEILAKKSPRFVRAMVEMSLDSWDTVKLFMEGEIVAELKEVRADNAGIRAALERGEMVVGARLLPREKRVKIE